MNLLWIPHAPFGRTRTRTEHLVDHLGRRHAIDVLDFRVYDRSQSYNYLFDLVRNDKRENAGYRRLFLPRIPRAPVLNAAILNRTIAMLCKSRNYDAIIVSPNPYLIGRLDFSAVPVPVVCDYLDGYDWAEERKGENYERYYASQADAVLCVSHRLLAQSLTVNQNSYYLPNGVDLERYVSYQATTEESKKLLGIDARKVVLSIIGLTCSERLYFIDAARELYEEGVDVQLLFVGEGPILEKIRKATKGLDHIVKIEGRIPYENILPYFRASDIGLYVVDDDSYYHFASPLKVFEYAAMGKPVIIAPKLDELTMVNLANFVFCEDNAASLKEAIVATTGVPGSIWSEGLGQYAWSSLAKNLEAILARVQKENRV